MLKYWKVILVVLLFTVIIAWMRRREDRVENYSDELLNTNIVFSGRISSMKISSNHNFGVVFIDIDTSTIDAFHKILVNSIFPYRIAKKKGEIYTLIPDGITVGNKVGVESNKKTIYYYNKLGKKKTEEYIFLVTDPIDIKFIDHNTNF